MAVQHAVGGPFPEPFANQLFQLHIVEPPPVNLSVNMAGEPALVVPLGNKKAPSYRMQLRANDHRSAVPPNFGRIPHLPARGASRPMPFSVTGEPGGAYPSGRSGFRVQLKEGLGVSS